MSLWDGSRLQLIINLYDLVLNATFIINLNCQIELFAPRHTSEMLLHLLHFAEIPPSLVLCHHQFKLMLVCL